MLEGLNFGGGAPAARGEAGVFLRGEHLPACARREFAVAVFKGALVDLDEREQGPLEVAVAVLADAFYERFERDAARAQQSPQVGVADGGQQIVDLPLFGITDSRGPVFPQPPTEQCSPGCVPGCHVDTS